jgi:DNA polymerase-3 subunit delta
MTIHLITGDDFLRSRAIAELKNSLMGDDSHSWDETHLDGDAFAPTRFVEALKSQSLFADGIIVHVKRVDKIADPKVLIPYLDGTEESKSPCIILEGEKLDKRGKFYKTLSKMGEVKDFPSPTKRDLPTALTQLLKSYGVKVAQPAFRYMLENVEGDLGRIGSEIRKLKLYADEAEITLDEMRGLLFHDREGDLFSSLDSLMERHPSAISKIQELLNGHEEPTKIYYMWANQVRSLIKIQALAAEGLPNDVIAKRTGDFPWLVSKRRTLAQSLPQRDLVNLIHSMHEEDLRIKRGERQPDEALWALVLGWLYPDANSVRLAHPLFAR